MRITLGTDHYAEWHPGARTINYYRFTLYVGDTGGFEAGRWVNYDCSSFGYDKPDNSTTQIEMLDVLMRHIEDVYQVDEPCCPACGEYIDYCQGHGRIADPLGYHIVRDHHDFDKHDRCHPASDCREDN